MPTTLYLNKFQRYLFLGFTVLILGGLGWYITHFSVWHDFPFGWALRRGLDALLLLFAAVCLYMVVFYWRYRLEFGPETLAFKAIPHLIARPWQLAYTDIRRVVYWPKLWQVWIVPHQGEARLLPLTGFEGGAPALLAALGQHLPAEKIQLGAEHLTKAQWRATWLLAGAMGLYLLVNGMYLYVGLGSRWWASSIAWQTAYPQPWLSRTPAFSLEPDGTVWLLVDDQDTYEAVRLRDDQTERWVLPPTSQWPPASFNHPEMIWGDATGQPAVALFSGDLLHWDGHTWVAHLTLSDSLSARDKATTEHELWVRGSVSNSPGQLTFLAIEPVSGTLREVRPPLPDPTAQFTPWNPTPASAGGLLIRATQQEHEFLWLYQQAQWTLLADWPWAQTVSIQALALDAAQQVWAIGDERFNPSVYQLGRFEPATKTWAWVALPPEVCCRRDNERLSFVSFQVDRLGRFWIQTNEAIEVVTLTPANTLQSLVRYTPETSNYQNRYDPVQLSADGRLWAADERLVWIDTTAPALPEPLPTELTFTQKQSAQWSMACAVFTLVVCLPGILFALWLTTRAQKALMKSLQAIP